MPSSVLGWKCEGEKYLLTSWGLLPRWELTWKRALWHHTIANALRGRCALAAVYKGGTRKSFLREPISRKVRGAKLYWWQYFKRRKEHEYTLKRREVVDYRCLTITVAISERQGGPEMVLECRQQQNCGGLWEACWGTVTWYELDGSEPRLWSQTYFGLIPSYITIFALLRKFFHHSMHVSFSSSIKWW